MGGKGSGAVTRYDAEYHDKTVTKLCRLGLTDEQVADVFFVTKQTIYNWQKKYPSFLEAMQAGKVISDAEVANALFHRAIGYSHDDVKIMQYEGEPVIVDCKKHYPPDTTAALAWLHNRQRANWQRNPDPSGDGEDMPPTKIVFEVKDARVRSNPADA